MKKAVKSNLKQRGCIEADGALTNTLLLNTFIKDRRSKTKTHTLVTQDVEKAFDSITNEAICNSLRRLGIDEHLTSYVMQDLAKSETIIKVSQRLPLADALQFRPG